MVNALVILYSTQGCHLCEMALELANQAGIGDKLEIIDIAFDDGLFSSYGVTIPVLHYQGAEINWPFDLKELTQWLEDNGITYHS